MDRLQAYTAIFRFMDRFWQERKADFDDDLPAILGSMSLRADDGYPWADSVWHDWIMCFPQANDISAEAAFAVMECYWHDYLALGEPETRDIGRMAQIIEASRDLFWQQWLQIVAEILGE